MSTTITASQEEQTTKSLHDRYMQLTTTHADNVSEIVKNVNFANGEMDEIKERFIELAAEQERLANSHSLKERMLRKMSGVPLIGSMANEAADTSRNERLKDETVSGIINKMFDGISTQAKSIGTAYDSFLKMHKNIIDNLSNMEKLSADISTEIATYPNGNAPYQLLNMSNESNFMLMDYKDKIKTIEDVIVVLQEIMNKIGSKLPAIKSSLLTDTAIKSGIDQLIKMSNDVKDLEELSITMSANIHNSTQESLVPLLANSAVSPESIKKLEDNAKKRVLLANKVQEAKQKRDESVNKAYAQTQLLIEQSKNANLALAAPTPVEGTIQ